MTPTRTIIAISAASILTVLCGCEDKPGPDPASKPAASPSTPGASSPEKSVPAPAASNPVPKPAGGETTAAASAGPNLNVMGMTFTVPDGWKQVAPANNMRLAEIQIPDAGGDASKACTIAFSTAGGDVLSNVNRWAGQIQDDAGKPAQADLKSKDVHGTKVNTVEFTGSYAGMGDGARKPDWMLRGAIIELPEGLLFIKMTGPKAPMTAAAAKFQSMVDGMAKSK
jgi:hypothetical protein